MKKSTPTAGVKIVLVPLQELTPNPQNARRHDAAQVENIANSIREFGFTNPIIADLEDDGIIVAGHGRRLAAQKIFAAGEQVKSPSGQLLDAGLVPVIDCSGWTVAQRRAYTLADNRLAESATWDDELLRLELSFLKTEAFNMDAVGFNEKELASIIDGWSSNIEAVENSGTHTDGITKTIKVTVSQADFDLASITIKEALDDKGIAFE